MFAFLNLEGHRGPCLLRNHSKKLWLVAFVSGNVFALGALSSTSQPLTSDLFWCGKPLARGQVFIITLQAGMHPGWDNIDGLWALLQPSRSSSAIALCPILKSGYDLFPATITFISFFNPKPTKVSCTKSTLRARACPSFIRQIRPELAPVAAFSHHSTVIKSWSYGPCINHVLTQNIHRYPGFY